MGYKVGVDKKQLSLIPLSLDDYIPQDHICRVIDAFTRRLNMHELGFKYADWKDKGCRPYDPRMMLNLYIYGYLNRVRSSRRLEKETRRNMEAIWLMEELKPDDRTISNFRKDNTKALREAFGKFVKMGVRLGLYGGEVEAQDGAKFRADNSRKNNHNKATVEKEQSRIDKQINEYLLALEQGDKEEEGEKEPNAATIKAALEGLKERKETYEKLKEEVEKEGETSTVDPDARLMHSGGDGRKLDVCYNVQTVVDSKHHLIVDFDLSDRSDDKGNLLKMGEKAKETLEAENIVMLADKGYYDGKDIVACEASGVTCMVAKPKAGGKKKEEGYSKERFAYDKENDCYVCPGRERLRYMRVHKHSDGKEYRLYANYRACRKCPHKGACTGSGKREILRLPYQDVLDAVDERTRKNKGLYKKRQEIVEHVFGTVKAVWGYKQFLCRTKPKVAAETAMAYLAYNMRRVINIFAERGENLAEALGQMA